MSTWDRDHSRARRVTRCSCLKSRWSAHKWCDVMFKSGSVLLELVTAAEFVSLGVVSKVLREMLRGAAWSRITGCIRKQTTTRVAQIALRTIRARGRRGWKQRKRHSVQCVWACGGSQPFLAHGSPFRKNYPMDHFAMLTPHEQLVKHKNLKMVLHNFLYSCTVKVTIIVKVTSNNFREGSVKNLRSPMWTTGGLSGPRWELLSVSPTRHNSHLWQFRNTEH